VLGNHDYAASRDPFSKPSVVRQLAPATLLSDGAATILLRGRRVQLVGVDPRSMMRRRARPQEFADPSADVRILLCHFPRIVAALPAGVFELVLAGHLHDGQIAIPWVHGKVRLGNPRARYPSGLYRTRAGTLHVSPGLGTTFVPFRFFARPEATELLLQPA
jgi:predicted MPP superfamily phosphohydrolase